MEDNIQEIFGIILSTLILFILPLYIAFEKKDDISYALAVKLTSEFVDNVKNNGYLSKTMYDDYVKKLSVTSNVYDIKMEHKSYEYNPIICSYKGADRTELVEIFDYNIYTAGYEKGTITYNGKSYSNLSLSFSKTDKVYTDIEILQALSLNTTNVYKGMTNAQYQAVNSSNIAINPNIYYSSEVGPIYLLNKGDEFTIRLKNTNTTIAESIFNMITLGMANESIPRVYVNYGATVENEKYKEWK